MSMLDRVKERIETDLSDDELTLMLNEANQDVINRYGPHADPDAPITVTVDASRRRALDIVRPIDTAYPVVITESVHDELELLADGDYRVLNGGRTLQRIGGAFGNGQWGDLVDVAYVPVADGNQRQEVIIGLVQLEAERRGVKSHKAGDLSVEAVDYVGERERLLQSLAPRRGLFVR